MKASILVHGGADTRLEGGAKKGVINAATSGMKFSDSALDMVQEAVRVLENDGHFGAGAGARLDIEGRVTQTANIIDGRTLESGAVALLAGIKNPVLVARKVMEETDNRLLAGEFTTEFALAFGFEKYDKISPGSMKEYLALKKQLKSRKEVDYFFSGPKLTGLLKSRPQLFGVDTVGATAIDKHGNMAAAGSSGGFTLQLPGRINDLAIIGAGLFADNNMGAVCVTGLGEFSIKHGMAREACRMLKEGLSPSKVSSTVMKLASKEKVAYGIIALTPDGKWAADCNCLPVMAHCHLTEGGKPDFMLGNKA